MIDDIKEAKPGEWYSKLKRITRFDQGKSELVQVDEISHLDDQEQAERIADNQAEISNAYREVQRSDILIPPLSLKISPVQLVPNQGIHSSPKAQEIYTPRGYPT